VELTNKTDLSGPSGNQVMRWSKWFIFSAGAIFLVTGLAKIVSASGQARILRTDDPIFGIPFRGLMFLVGDLELVISAICLFSKKWKLSLGLVFLMAANFTAYRMGLWWIGWKSPCSCLGNITDALKMSPQMADLIMKYVLMYLLAGSITLLFWNKTLANQGKRNLNNISLG
jgi:hypothetical protein